MGISDFSEELIDTHIIPRGKNIQWGILGLLTPTFLNLALEEKDHWLGILYLKDCQNFA
jgi:hypothetical protein